MREEPLSDVPRSRSARRASRWVLLAVVVPGAWGQVGPVTVDPADRARELSKPAKPEGTEPRQVCVDGACTLTYEPAFFQRYAPVTALDMVNNLPGFAIDDGDNDTRGFGGAAGNIVINGARISAKSETPSDILGRIPAADVERIEVIRGQVAGLDLRGQNVVANVIRRGGATSGAWNAGARSYDPGGGVYPFGELSLSSSPAFGDFTAALAAREFKSIVARRERLFGADGELKENRFELSDEDGEEYSATLNAVITRGTTRQGRGRSTGPARRAAARLRPLSPQAPENKGKNMHPLLTTIAVSLLSALLIVPAHAGRDDFHAGELIPAYGMIAEVPGVAPLPPDTTFKLAIDVVEGGETGKLNSRFVTAAAFLNLQHAGGIPPENIEIALVVHGPAHRDILTDEAYGGRNPNADLLAALQKYQVSVYYCGQSGVARDISSDDLLPGVEVTHSATTTHVLLQQQGFALRP